MSKIAFIGLGVMGFPMAGHLARAGHDVTVFNRTTAKAEAWVKTHDGSAAATPRAAAHRAEFVFACVGNDDDLREVTAGPDGAFHGMDPGAIFVDHTTASAAVARELHAGRERYATKAGASAPDREDTLFIAMLAASAAFGEAIIGRQLAESAGLDQDGLKRFRLWFARLVKDHLDSGK